MTEIVIAWKSRDGDGVTGCRITNDGPMMLGKLLSSDKLEKICVSDPNCVVIMTTEQSRTADGTETQLNKLRSIVKADISVFGDVSERTAAGSPGWRVAEAIIEDYHNFYDQVVEAYGDYEAGPLNMTLN